MKDPHPLYGVIEPAWGSKHWSDPRSVEGRSRGFGWCLSCGGTWDWAKPFNIPISGRRSCFPVCFECGGSMTDAEILAYLKRHDDHAAQFYPMDGPDGKKIERELFDLEYAEKAVVEWRANRQEGEDPHATRFRLFAIAEEARLQAE